MPAMFTIKNWSVFSYILWKIMHHLWAGNFKSVKIVTTDYINKGWIYSCLRIQFTHNIHDNNKFTVKCTLYRLETLIYCHLERRRQQLKSLNLRCSQSSDLKHTVSSIYRLRSSNKEKGVSVMRYFQRNHLCYVLVYILSHKMSKHSCK